MKFVFIHGSIIATEEINNNLGYISFEADSKEVNKYYLV